MFSPKAETSCLQAFRLASGLLGAVAGGGCLELVFMDFNIAQKTITTRRNGTKPWGRQIFLLAITGKSLNGTNGLISFSPFKKW